MIGLIAILYNISYIVVHSIMYVVMMSHHVVHESCTKQLSWHIMQNLLSPDTI